MPILEEFFPALILMGEQRNRLAYRYLNFRWQTISFFREQRRLAAKVAELILQREDSK